LSAPSGAGKTSLARALVAARPDAGLTISHTTRPQRPGETTGVDYHFVDHQTFEEMIRRDLFVEHAEVFGNYYGTSLQAIQAELDAGRNAVLEIDWQGARKVRLRYPAACSVFIMPPSRGALEQRLRSRGQDSDGVIARRMQAADSEMSHRDEYHRIIVNDDFDRALDELNEVLDDLGAAGSTSGQPVGDAN
jgi:guanylate kinase